MKRSRILFLATAAVVASCGPLIAQSAVSSSAQEATPAPRWSWPETMENAQVLPADTDTQRLRGTMIMFAQSLKVRCSHCHVGTGNDLSQYDFASDENPKKETARDMLRLMNSLNTDQLPAIAGLSEPQVTCFTCHRGSIEPAIRPVAGGS